MASKKYILRKALKTGAHITTQTHAVGGGEWSIEVYADVVYLFELVGPNGTRDGEEAADLHGELQEMFPVKTHNIHRQQKRSRPGRPGRR